MVKNVLRDGTVLADMTGHVVKKESIPIVYEIMERINDDRRSDGKQKQKE